MIVVLSQGCAANFGDGEKIARILSKKSEVSFEFPEESVTTSTQLEAFYLNVCTVKGNAGAMKLLRKAANTYPNVPVYITGCAPKDFREEAIRVVPQVQFTTLSDLENDPQFISISGNVTQDRTSERNGSITRHKNVLRESPFVGIVNIEEGCLDACAFCSTHLVKGRLHSFAPNDIVDQVQALVDDGCLEIQLTGQDCACYGFDIGTNLAELTQRILTHVTSF